MTSVRCPSCGAGCPETAQWCSMCYHQFRSPESEPVVVPTPAPETAPEPPAVAVVDPLTAPLPALTGERPVTVALGAPTREAPAAAWPCPVCGASVPLVADGCECCGAGFLAPAKNRISLRLPVVGDLVELTQTQRIGVAVVVAFGFTLVLVLLAALVGAVF